MPETAVSAVGETLRENGLAAPAPGGGMTFLQAKTANEVLKAQERRLRLAKLIEMLRAPEGPTIAEIVAATGWQPHTVRGAIAGALKKKLGLEVTSEKVEGRGRVYRLPA